MLNVYTNPVFYEHDTGAGHPESATRLDAALTGVERAGLADRISRDTAGHPDADRIIAKVHSEDYHRALDLASRSGMDDFFSGDNPMSSQTFSAARTAVGSALTAAEEMMREAGNRAFVVARPPGHHAERLEPMGFCFFNTIACVAEWMREQPGIERVFVFDFDVHHGNGTAAIFESDTTVYTLSIHQENNYPMPKPPSDEDIGLEDGTRDQEYLGALENGLLRALKKMTPDIIFYVGGADDRRFAEA